MAQLGDTQLYRPRPGVTVAAIALIDRCCVHRGRPHTGGLPQAFGRRSWSHGPFSNSSRRAILSSVIVVVLGFRLCLDNPTLPSTAAVTAVDKSPAYADSWRSLRWATYPPLLHHALGHDRGACASIAGLGHGRLGTAVLQARDAPAIVDGVQGCTAGWSGL